MSSRKRPQGKHKESSDSRIGLLKDKLEFTVHCPIAQTKQILGKTQATVSKVGESMSKVKCKNQRTLNSAMKKVRNAHVAHHLYRDAETKAKCILGQHVYLRLYPGNENAINSICRAHRLTMVDRIGSVVVLRLSDETGCNPLKLADILRNLPVVESCIAETISPTEPAGTDTLIDEQWHLSKKFIAGVPIKTFHELAAVRADEAWAYGKGNAEVVVAVMDDGFDLDHPVFGGTGKVDSNLKDFITNSNDPRARSGDEHGTPVAALAIGNCDVFLGVAPNCGFLPLRIRKEITSARDIIKPIRHASLHADILNISLQFVPGFIRPDILSPGSGFLEELREITTSGGRRGKGLVIVVAAGNYDMPTGLQSNLNKFGFKYFAGSRQTIGSGVEVYSGYPNLPGVIVVSALSSKLRKAGYSNWGKEVSVCAPSSNSHSHPDFQNTAFPGVSLVTATNKFNGKPLDPIPDNPATTFVDSQYTKTFGGTSGAAPIVAGIAALILSANPELEAWEVRRIIESTANKGLDPTLDLTNDPNLRGFNGDFENGKSLFFGAGRVDALRCVEKAKAFREQFAPEFRQKFESTPNLTVDSTMKAGAVDHIVLAPGIMRNIKVKIRGSHPDRSKLVLTLISPTGYLAELPLVTSGAVALNEDFTSQTTPSLGGLVTANVVADGRWTLHVRDLGSLQVGQITSWSLEVS